MGMHLLVALLFLPIAAGVQTNLGQEQPSKPGTPSGSRRSAPSSADSKNSTLLSAQAHAQKFPNYPVRNASEYLSCQTKNGIRVAIEPVSDTDEQQKYFRTKFGSQGFLPVLVVLENASEGNGLLLRKDLVTYRIEGARSGEQSGGGLTARTKTGEGVALAGAALSLPAMFIGLKMIAAASEVKQNILVKELRSQTIPPGKVGSGFLYVPIGKPGKEKRKITLIVPVALAGSEESIVFTFDLDVPEDK